MNETEKNLKDSDLYERAYRYKEKRSTTRFYCILLLIVIIAFSFRAYFVGHYGLVEVDGTSMNMTLRDGDKLLIKYGQEAKRGDIIVVDIRRYHIPDSYTSGKEKEFLIKRLIGVEGDKIYGEGEQLYICYAGTKEYVPLKEEYAYYKGGAPNAKFLCGSASDPYIVGKGEVFFLGDNRLNSTDSRYKDGLSNLRCLYKATDIYGVVSEWALEHKNFLPFLPT